MRNVADELFHLLIFLEVGVVGLARIHVPMRGVGDAEGSENVTEVLKYP